MNGDAPLDPLDLACRDLVEIVTDYLEGVLPADRAEQVRGHLALCPGCAEYVAQMRQTAGALRGLSAAMEPAGLDPAVKARLVRAFLETPRD